MTDADRHNAVKAAFLEAVATPVEERDALLDRLCAGNAEMRREVDTLLQYSGDASQTISISREKPPRFQTGDEFASRLARSFFEAAFAPRVPLSQADANGLDGSNRVSRDPLETIFGHEAPPRIDE